MDILKDLRKSAEDYFKHTHFTDTLTHSNNTCYALWDINGDHIPDMIMRNNDHNWVRVYSYNPNTKTVDIISGMDINGTSAVVFPNKNNNGFTIFNHKCKNDDLVLIKHPYKFVNGKLVSSKDDQSVFQNYCKPKVFDNIYTNFYKEIIDDKNNNIESKKELYKNISNSYHKSVGSILLNWTLLFGDNDDLLDMIRYNNMSKSEKNHISEVRRWMEKGYRVVTGVVRGESFDSDDNVYIPPNYYSAAGSIMDGDDDFYFTQESIKKYVGKKISIALYLPVRIFGFYPFDTTLEREKRVQLIKKWEQWFKTNDIAINDYYHIIP